jgi:dCTP deaminase
MVSNNILINDYLFELIERISRFYIHLEEIKTQFYLNSDNKVNDKLMFVDSYKECLVKHFEIGMTILKKTQESKDGKVNYVKDINSVFKSISNLHSQYLSHLPRPSEPIELRRFCRIIDKHVVNLKKVITREKNNLINDSTISIYLSEDIGESTFVKDPLSKFKNENINKIIKEHNKTNNKSISFLEDKKGNTNYHISIPRIDANNPCRWPTLMHEVAHNIMRKEYFKGKTIDQDFNRGLDEIQTVFISKLAKTIDIKSWLIECWCDLFACLVMGPAFWFSQFSSFVFQGNGDNEKTLYPPALFRLQLIERILDHRFSKILTTTFKESIKSSESIILNLDNSETNYFQNDDDTRQLFMYFRIYFLHYFFNTEKRGITFLSKELNKNLKPLIKYTKVININTIEELVKALSNGFPIPSKYKNKKYLIEKPTYVQEILLAAWLYRNSTLKKRVFSEINKNNRNNYEDLLSIIINKYFKKFDTSILRSIQVSEWFDLYTSTDIDKINKEKYTIDKINTVNIGILNDYEILKLLKDEELKIIPIMNIKNQLGSTSLDIRLGTSFQVYLHTKYGIIDFSDKNRNENIYNSKMIDLDYFESITISPGQFILGHSMEYLKFPKNLAGQIDGRSSFARLGLQVHMTAGLVDPGFEGVLTFEMFNNGPSPIRLYPGFRIAQLRFIPINQPMKPYNKNIEAKYKELFSYHDSMQFKDYEIKKITHELERKNKF